MAKVLSVTKSKIEMLTIELTGEEVDALCEVLARVGGHPVTSRRGHVEKVWDALRGAGAQWTPGYCFGDTDIEGKIVFRDRP